MIRGTDDPPAAESPDRLAPAENPDRRAPSAIQRSAAARLQAVLDPEERLRTRLLERSRRPDRAAAASRMGPSLEPGRRAP